MTYKFVGAICPCLKPILDIPRMFTQHHPGSRSTFHCSARCACNTYKVPYTFRMKALDFVEARVRHYLRRSKHGYRILAKIGFPNPYGEIPSCNK